MKQGSDPLPRRRRAVDTELQRLACGLRCSSPKPPEAWPIDSLSVEVHRHAFPQEEARLAAS